MEAEIQALGRRLVEASKTREPLTFTPRWWQERLLDWATGEPDFRVKLLRFVDVLPSLRSAAAVGDHVRQYFREDAPAALQLASGLANQPAFRPVVSRIVREGVQAMSQRFIAGATPLEAVPRLRELAASGVGYTVDLLGEATLSDSEADAFLSRYLDLLNVLSGAAPGPKSGAWRDVPPVNVSIKLSALTAQFEPAAPRRSSERVRQRLRPLLTAAREQGAFINVDMEQYRFRDLVHQVFADVLMEPDFRDFADVGIVVQAYLRDAEEDLRRLHSLAESRGTPITVRLVKGAYWDEERIVAGQNQWPSPVYEDKAATDASYERCAELLLNAWPHLRPAFASHNPRSVAQAIVACGEHGLPREQIEFQMLFGMAEELRSAVEREGFRTRVYVPIGEVIPGMAYLVRRLLENTSNQAWFVRDHNMASVEQLLAKPEVAPAVASVRPEGFHNTAPAEFHKPGQREAMTAALLRIRQTPRVRQPLLVAGERIFDRRQEVVVYPAEPSLQLGAVAQATREDVDAAVLAAKTAFPSWRALPAERRSAILRHAADLLEARRFEFAALMVYESAKPWHEADGDVSEACDYLRYYASEAERLLAPLRMGDAPGEANAYQREPRGVTAVIAPWNFPLAIICGMSVAALASGNCAILKPASQSPLIAARLVELLQEAGVPPEVVQYLPGSGQEAGMALVQHPDVQTIAFTGSKQVGLSIIEAAAKLAPGQRELKRVIAELGGKNAIVVDDDADLDTAVAGVIASAFGYAGQKCSACSRLIVVGSAYDPLLKRLREAVISLDVGTPHDPASFVPPVISHAAQERILAYIEHGKATARLLAQAECPQGGGFYVAPTVFAEVALNDRLAREEIFGPVLSVFRAGSFSQALALANDSEYALTGGVFSRNPRNIELARHGFAAGNIYINRKTTGAVVGRQPFGGFRLSGLGHKAGGPDYLLQFLQARSISESTVRRGFAPEAQ